MAKRSGPETRAARRREPAKPRTRTEQAPPLDALTPERRGDFLELALLPEDLLRLCRKLGLSAPGYRLERLSSPDHAALLADELPHSEKAREVIEEAVLASLKAPLLRTQWLTSVAARELTQVIPGDPITALARLAWRCLGDEDPSVKAIAERALDAGLALLDQAANAAGEATGEAGTKEKQGDSATEPAGTDDTPRQLDELERRAARAERDRESARAQLQHARADVAERDRRLTELKQELAELRVETTKQASELARLGTERGTDERRGAHELRKAAAERAHFEGKVADLEERLAAEKRRADDAVKQAAEKGRPTGAPSADDAEMGDAAEAAEFVTPLFTDEFYESLEGWDRRIVKSAFEKALLLARDRRHPSLRALALEGIDNYFRIRVATDVRLIYRRAEDGRIELLSLIDREDLDRYVRQAKTRHA